MCMWYTQDPGIIKGSWSLFKGEKVTGETRLTCCRKVEGDTEGSSPLGKVKGQESAASSPNRTAAPETRVIMIVSNLLR